MTPSKCRDTDGVGNASPGPGRKCLREFGARDEDWYAFSSGLTSTVIRTRYDCVVYTAHDTLQPPNTTPEHTRRTWMTILLPSGAHSAVKFTPCSSTDVTVRERCARTADG